MLLIATLGANALFIESNAVGTSATVDTIYNLEGKRNGDIKSGMNILRMSNGTTRKIMKLRTGESDCHFL